MTGINSDLVGSTTIDILLKEFNKLSNNDIFNENEILQIGDLETVLINSDFDIKCEINRENLHRVIVDNGYLSSYEPCNYPGVNIKYYFNPLKRNFGICDCDKPCNGKGLNNTCKKITIAVLKVVLLLLRVVEIKITFKRLMNLLQNLLKKIKVLF